MRKIYLNILLLLILCISCSRSQFSVTQRQYRNGKVTYQHYHPVEHSGSSKIKAAKGSSVITSSKKRSRSTGQDIEPVIPVTGIMKIKNDAPQGKDQLLASRSGSTVRITANKIRLNPGNNEIILKRNPKPVTVSPARAASSSRSDPVDVKALLGFIFSILGLIPVIGLIFAIAAVVLSGISLHQFNNGTHWGAKSGKWMAVAGMAIGVVAIILNIIFIAIYISTMSIGLSGSISII